MGYKPKGKEQYPMAYASKNRKCPKRIKGPCGAQPMKERISMAKNNNTPIVSSRDNVSVFTFENATVRIFIDKNGGPWFIAKDVCDILGLSNNRKAISSLDDDEKNTVTISDGIPGNPNKTIVSEPGLYKLIMRSRKPEAKSFQRWVTHEVLPAIRKTGGYNTTATLEQLVASPDMVIALANKVKEERAARELAETALHDFTDPAGTYDLKTAAKILNRTPGIKTGANRLAKWLEAHDWCYREKDGKHDLLTPYQRAVEAGWLEVRAYQPFTDSSGKTHRRVQVRITGRGLERIRLLMLTDMQPDSISTVGGREIGLFEELEG